MYKCNLKTFSHLKKVGTTKGMYFTLNDRIFSKQFPYVKFGFPSD